MEGDEDPATRDALAVLQDVVQLCAVMRGETDSCSFTSMCSDCFTGIAMQHLHQVLLCSRPATRTADPVA